MFISQVCLERINAFNRVNKTNQNTLLVGLLVGVSMLSGCSHAVSDEDILRRAILHYDNDDKTELTIADRVNDGRKMTFIVKTKSGQVVYDCNVFNISLFGNSSDMECVRKVN